MSTSKPGEGRAMTPEALAASLRSAVESAMNRTSPGEGGEAPGPGAASAPGYAPDFSELVTPARAPAQASTPDASAQALDGILRRVRRGLDEVATAAHERRPPVAPANPRVPPPSGGADPGPYVSALSQALGGFVADLGTELRGTLQLIQANTQASHQAMRDILRHNADALTREIARQQQDILTALEGARATAEAIRGIEPELARQRDEMAAVREAVKTAEAHTARVQEITGRQTHALQQLAQRLANLGEGAMAREVAAVREEFEQRVTAVSGEMGALGSRFDKFIENVSASTQNTAHRLQELADAVTALRGQTSRMAEIQVVEAQIEARLRRELGSTQSALADMNERLQNAAKPSQETIAEIAKLKATLVELRTGLKDAAGRVAEIEAQKAGLAALTARLNDLEDLSAQQAKQPSIEEMAARIGDTAIAEAQKRVAVVSAQLEERLDSRFTDFEYFTINFTNLEDKVRLMQEAYESLPARVTKVEQAAGNTVDAQVWEEKALAWASQIEGLAARVEELAGQMAKAAPGADTGALGAVNARVEELAARLSALATAEAVGDLAGRFQAWRERVEHVEDMQAKAVDAAAFEALTTAVRALEDRMAAINQTVVGSATAASVDELRSTVEVAQAQTGAAHARLGALEGQIAATANLAETVPTRFTGLEERLGNLEGAKPGAGGLTRDEVLAMVRDAGQGQVTRDEVLAMVRDAGQGQVTRDDVLAMVRDAGQGQVTRDEVQAMVRDAVQTVALQAENTEAQVRVALANLPPPLTMAQVQEAIAAAPSAAGPGLQRSDLDDAVNSLRTELGVVHHEIQAKVEGSVETMLHALALRLDRLEAQAGSADAANVRLLESRLSQAEARLSQMKWDKLVAVVKQTADNVKAVSSRLAMFEAGGAPPTEAEAGAIEE